MDKIKKSLENVLTIEKTYVNICLEIQTERGEIMFNFDELLGRMKSKGYSQMKMAKELGISENSFSNKISGKSSFKPLEIVSMCEKLDISNTQIGFYFFTT